MTKLCFKAAISLTLIFAFASDASCQVKQMIQDNCIGCHDSDTNTNLNLESL
jgi:hypothetical protein